MPDQKPKPSKAAEVQFSRALRRVARASGHIVDAHVDGSKLDRPDEMKRALDDYAKLIKPWASRQSMKMLEKVSKANARDFSKASKLMGKLLRENVAQAQTGLAARGLMEEQVLLIQSIPIRAGRRAQFLAQKAFYEGSRADEIAEELAATTEVSESDAMRIARTEVARANAVITEVRAKAVGSTWYIWRATMDGATRHSHAEMNGQPVKYDQPPTLDDMEGHAGTFPNCRCYQDPQFDEPPSGIRRRTY